nr:MAG TPA: hypothetical protein [Caudoviricetes sp.]
MHCSLIAAILVPHAISVALFLWGLVFVTAAWCFLRWAVCAC